MNQLSNHPNSQVLNSWKEIATHLGRGVRTVQRWEQELQLPVHRIGIGSRSPVFAFEHELRFWLHSTNPPNEYPAPAVASEARAARVSVISRSIELAQQLLSATQENRRLMIQLARGMERIQQACAQARGGEATRAKVRAVAGASLVTRALQHKDAVPVVVALAPDECYVTAAS